MAHYELTQDMSELSRLCQYATRPNVKKLIQGCLESLQEEFTNLPTPVASSQASASAVEDGASGDVEMKEPTPKVFDTKITSYAWDQSDKFVKIYATGLPGVQGLPADNIQCEFTSKSFHLTVCGLNGKNYHLNIVSLYEKIDPATSRHKVKSDSVLVMLRKHRDGMKWEGVNELDKIKKQKSDQELAASKDEDPQASIMNLMKKMYDEGDDNMKRNIAKAWSESRDKKDKGDDPDV